MKYITILLMSLITTSLSGQATESDDIKSTIENFFTAFHQQDSTKLRSMVTKNIIMQSISKNKDGEVVLNQTDFGRFLTGIASIPSENTFQEKILDYSIQIDGNMANAWTPYEFWYNGNLSHCGVNSFQLLKKNNQWKIFFLVDTRRRDKCNKS